MKLQACGLTVLRVVVGIVFVAHGYQKLFKFGFHGVADMFGHLGTPLPLFFAVVVTLVEFVGGILLIAGIAVQISAALIALDMVVAILKVHLPHGFFNSSGGVEFPLTLLAAAVCLSLSGGGAWSLKK
jgi:putative oxidoreductase